MKYMSVETECPNSITTGTFMDREDRIIIEDGDVLLETQSA